MSTQDQRFAFIVDWYDAQASLIRQYQFLFYPKDNSVEMYDMKNKKKFFSRSKIDKFGKFSPVIQFTHGQVQFNSIRTRAHNVIFITIEEWFPFFHYLVYQHSDYNQLYTKKI